MNVQKSVTRFYVAHTTINLKRALSLSQLAAEIANPSSDLYALSAEAGRLAGLSGISFPAWRTLSPDALGVPAIDAAFRSGWHRGLDLRVIP